eukprot:TRINITY_DN22679_c0_g1_i1.p1 TRINITY_DN22679_c0_g1~~TRINITY_DN22679_c0_g1_i1.p1  ORF type:complete len:1501 (-),score=314.51 TRINITY_DN22679_c0_g1_i1:202-4170(-)
MSQHVPTQGGADRTGGGAVSVSVTCYAKVESPELTPPDINYACLCTSVGTGWATKLPRSASSVPEDAANVSSAGSRRLEDPESSAVPFVQRKSSGVCLRGIATKCEDCPHAPRCATISTLAGDGTAGAHVATCPYEPAMLSQRDEDPDSHLRPGFYEVTGYRECSPWDESWIEPDARSPEECQMLCAGFTMCEAITWLPKATGNNCFLYERGTCHENKLAQSTRLAKVYFKTEVCGSPQKQSLSKPTSIAFDDQDNMYIADLGNNRIHLLLKQMQVLTTIAGSGQVGFTGDGGRGILASMRGPEGLAVRRSRFTGFVEVFFSDVGNQRIRRVTLNGHNEWIIDTVLGTGFKGSNPGCDAGCASEEATLNNPRGMAFSEAQDLYLIDSGSRRILRLTADLSWVSVFVGRKTSHVSDHFVKHLGLLLSGHWQQPNDDVVLHAIQGVTVDREQNLIFADSMHNRIWMSPTQMNTYVTVPGPTNDYVNAYLLHFTQNFENEQSMKFDLAGRLSSWLLADGLIDVEPVLSVETSSMEVGMSYWQWGAGAQRQGASWCQEKGKDCLPKPAQELLMGSPAGLCAGRVNGIGIADQKASEMLEVTKREAPQGPAADSEVRDTRGCKCLQYWVNPEVVESLLLDTSWQPEWCYDNPNIDRRYKFFPRKHPRAGQPVPCSATDFCGDLLPESSTGVQVCFIDRSGLSSEESCGSPAFRNWGYCRRNQRQTEWSRAIGVGLLGEPMRQTRKVVQGKNTIKGWIPDMDKATLMFKEDQEALAAGLEKTAVLVGYVQREDLNTVPICQNYSYTMVENNTGARCNFLGGGDPPLEPLEALDEYMKISKQPTMELYWDMPRSIDVGLAEFGLSDCFDECRETPSCKAVMLGWNLQVGQPLVRLLGGSGVENQGFSLRDIGLGDDKLMTMMQRGDAVEPALKEQSRCYFFAETHPFALYTANRSAFAGQEALAKRRIFEGPRFVFNRLFGRDGDPLISPSMKGLLDGPISNASLMLSDCMDLCIAHSECNTIAFPGCYLLKIPPPGGPNPPGVNPVVDQHSTKADDTLGRYATAVYVRQELRATAEGIAGQADVWTSTGGRGDISKDIARKTPLNRPTSCAYDIEGRMHITDTWNNRIRKIDGRRVPCLYSSKQPMSLVEDYQAKVQAIWEKCTVTPDLEHLYAVMQKHVMERRPGNFSTMSRHFCRHPSQSSWKIPAFLDSWTDSAAVLCTVCGSLASSGDRPEVCPGEELCQCRSAMIDALNTTVYTKCKLEDARVDEWHRWISAVLECYRDSNASDPQWLTDATKRQQLTTALAGYNALAGATSRRASSEKLHYA